MKQSYDDIIEALYYYAALGCFDELYAILSLLERHKIPQPIVEQLKGDLCYLFGHLQRAQESYSKAAMIYQRNGELKKASSLSNVIERIERKK